MKNNKLKNLLRRTDSRLVDTLKTALGAFPIHFLGLLFSTIVSIYVSRNFGASGTGVLSLSRRIVEFSVLLTLIGTAPTYLVKMISQQIALGKSDDLNNKIITLLCYVFPLAIISTLLVIFYSEDIAKFINNKELPAYLIVFALNIIPFSLIGIFSAALNGKKQVVENIFFKILLSPLLTLCFIGISYLFEVKLSLRTVFYIITGSNFIVCGILLAYWFKQNKLKIINLSFKSDIINAFPFLVLSLSTFIYSKIDVFIIDYYLDTENVGLYSVAFRLGMLITLIHMIVGKTLAPTISELITLNKKAEIEKILQSFSLILFLVSIVVFILFLVFGKSILSFWGDEFTSSFYCLLVIVFGQCFNISTGHTGMALMMAGYEKIVSKIIFFMVPVNIGLNLWLISSYGIIGAAVSFTVCIVIQNIIKYILVFKYLNINPIYNFCSFEKA